MCFDIFKLLSLQALPLQNINALVLVVLYIDTLCKLLVSSQNHLWFVINLVRLSTYHRPLAHLIVGICIVRDFRRV